MSKKSHVNIPAFSVRFSEYKWQRVYVVNFQAFILKINCDAISSVYFHIVCVSFRLFVIFCVVVCVLFVVVVAVVLNCLFIVLVSISYIYCGSVTIQIWCYYLRVDGLSTNSISCHCIRCENALTPCYFG